jgi:hypothetical protein
MANSKPDKDLYRRLRDSGLRKKTARRAAEAIPSKGPKSPAAAHKVADEVSSAAEAIRDRAGGGSRKRSKAAVKAARTRKVNGAKRSKAARKGAAARR